MFIYLKFGDNEFKTASILLRKSEKGQYLKFILPN